MSGVPSGFSVPSGVFNPILVSQLPSSPNSGQVAAVFDAATAGLTFGQTLSAGGGGNKYLVWWNGSNWTVIGA